MKQARVARAMLEVSISLLVASVSTEVRCQQACLHLPLYFSDPVGPCISVSVTRPHSTLSYRVSVVEWKMATEAAKSVVAAPHTSLLTATASTALEPAGARQQHCAAWGSWPGGQRDSLGPAITWTSSSGKLIISKRIFL